MPSTSRRRTARIAALLATGLALVTAQAASADGYTPDAAATQAAQRIAVAWWGTTPCGGNVTITWDTLTVGVNASSSWSNPVSSYGAPDLNSDCVVTFNSAQSFDWPMFCTVMVHEYGHLTGHQHSPDPNDVMTPVYDGPVAPCTSGPGSAPAPTTTTAPATTTRAATGATDAPVATGHHRQSATRRARSARRHHGRRSAHRTALSVSAGAGIDWSSFRT